MIYPTMLEGKRIQLLPLRLDHAEELFKCAGYPEIWTYLPNKVEKFEDMVELINNSIQAKESGLEYPFVVYDKELKKLVGSTRLLNISEANRNFEIGWTWYTPEVWRTRVNTECKYVLLKYGFEEFQAVRIQFKADIRNERSNRAIERIGAVKEGILRQDRILHDGYIRNAYIYSVIRPEWPDIKMKLEEYLSN
ncbi:GNAT family N-acetyltransferase [Paenibacillus sambharensis]|uniref:GNAT family N-acetyltransferase n=1 Tax=Paenibacillus sambharensis TaxID=1803190 RepID=A0A2W1LGN6_9BACL|nr:GNAT family protein [Paenibacillus sambharensis]PZD97230.1 GNAT family N-acetyltransferase [Paenibacillus sambharensis]